MKSINAGNLRHKVTILKRTAGSNDEYGGATYTWSEHSTQHAMVAPFRGDERFVAQQVQAEISHQVTIRYTADTTTEMRIHHDLHPANISSNTAAGGGNNYILLATVLDGPNDVVPTDDTYNGYGITIVSGTGSGQHRVITDYDHAGHVSGDRYAEVGANWDTNPDNTSVYRICQQYLNIEAIINVEERDTYLELLCREAV